MEMSSELRVFIFIIFCGYFGDVYSETEIWNSMLTKSTYPAIYSSTSIPDSAQFKSTHTLTGYFQTTEIPPLNSNSVKLQTSWVESVVVINNSLVLTKQPIAPKSVSSVLRTENKKQNEEMTSQYSTFQTFEKSDVIINDISVLKTPVFVLKFDPMGQDIFTPEFKEKFKNGLELILKEMVVKHQRSKRETQQANITIEIERITTEGPNKGEVFFIVKIDGVPLPPDEAQEILKQLTPQELNDYLGVEVQGPISVANSSALGQPSILIQISPTVSNYIVMETSSSMMKARPEGTSNFEPTGIGSSIIKELNSADSEISFSSSREQTRPSSFKINPSTVIITSTKVTNSRDTSQSFYILSYYSGDMMPAFSADVVDIGPKYSSIQSTPTISSTAHTSSQPSSSIITKSLSITGLSTASAVLLSQSSSVKKLSRSITAMLSQSSSVKTLSRSITGMSTDVFPSRSPSIEGAPVLSTLSLSPSLTVKSNQAPPSEITTSVKSLVLLTSSSITSDEDLSLPSSLGKDIFESNHDSVMVSTTFSVLIEASTTLSLDGVQPGASNPFTFSSSISTSLENQGFSTTSSEYMSHSSTQTFIQSPSIDAGTNSQLNSFKSISLTSSESILYSLSPAVSVNFSDSAMSNILDVSVTSMAPNSYSSSLAVMPDSQEVSVMTSEYIYSSSPSFESRVIATSLDSFRIAPTSSDSSSSYNSTLNIESTKSEDVLTMIPRSVILSMGSSADGESVQPTTSYGNDDLSSSFASNYPITTSTLLDTSEVVSLGVGTRLVISSLPTISTNVVYDISPTSSINFEMSNTQTIDASQELLGNLSMSIMNVKTDSVSADSNVGHVTLEPSSMTPAYSLDNPESSVFDQGSIKSSVLVEVFSSTASVLTSDTNEERYLLTMVVDSGGQNTDDTTFREQLKTNLELLFNEAQDLNKAAVRRRKRAAEQNSNVTVQLTDVRKLGRNLTEVEFTVSVGGSLVAAEDAVNMLSGLSDDDIEQRVGFKVVKPISAVVSQNLSEISTFSPSSSILATPSLSITGQTNGANLRSEKLLTVSTNNFNSMKTDTSFLEPSVSPGPPVKETLSSIVSGSHGYAQTYFYVSGFSQISSATANLDDIMLTLSKSSSGKSSDSQYVPIAPSSMTETYTTMNIFVTDILSSTESFTANDILPIITASSESQEPLSYYSTVSDSYTPVSLRSNATVSLVSKGNLESLGSDKEYASSDEEYMSVLYVSSSMGYASFSMGQVSSDIEYSPSASGYSKYETSSTPTLDMGYEPSSGYSVSEMGYSSHDMTYQTSDTGYSTFDTEYPVSDLGYSTSGMVYSSFDMGLLVSDMTTSASSTGYIASDIGFSTSDMTTSSSEMPIQASNLIFSSSEMISMLSKMSTLASSDMIYSSDGIGYSSTEMGFFISDMTTSSEMSTTASSDMVYVSADMGLSVSGMTVTSEISSPESSDMGYASSAMGFSVSDMTTLLPEISTAASDMGYSASEVGYSSSGMVDTSSVIGFALSGMTASSKMATPASDMGYSASDLRSAIGFSASDMTTLLPGMTTPISDMGYSASDLGYSSSGMVDSQMGFSVSDLPTSSKMAIPASDMVSSASDLEYLSSGIEISVSSMTLPASYSVETSSMGYLKSTPDYSHVEISNIFNPSIGIESSSNDMGSIPYTTLGESLMDGLSTQINVSLPSKILPTIVRSSNAATSDFAASTATYLDITTTIRTVASFVISSNGNLVSPLNILTTSITPTDTTTPISTSVAVPEPNLGKYLLKMRFNPLGTDYTEQTNKQKLINSLVRLFEAAMRKQGSLSGVLRRKKRDTETGSSNIKVKLDTLDQSTSTSATALFTVDLGNGPISADEATGLLNLLSKDEIEDILGVELLEPIGAANVQSDTIYTSASITLPQPTPLLETTPTYVVESTEKITSEVLMEQTVSFESDVSDFVPTTDESTRVMTALGTSLRVSSSTSQLELTKVADTPQFETIMVSSRLDSQGISTTSQLEKEISVLASTDDSRLYTGSLSMTISPSKSQFGSSVSQFIDSQNVSMESRSATEGSLFSSLTSLLPNIPSLLTSSPISEISEYFSIYGSSLASMDYEAGSSDITTTDSTDYYSIPSYSSLPETEFSGRLSFQSLVYDSSVPSTHFSEFQSLLYDKSEPSTIDLYTQSSSFEIMNPASFSLSSSQESIPLIPVAPSIISTQTDTQVSPSIVSFTTGYRSEALSISPTKGYSTPENSSPQSIDYSESIESRIFQTMTVSSRDYPLSYFDSTDASQTLILPMISFSSVDPSLNTLGFSNGFDYTNSDIILSLEPSSQYYFPINPSVSESLLSGSLLSSYEPSRYSLDTSPYYRSGVSSSQYNLSVNRSGASVDGSLVVETMLSIYNPSSYIADTTIMPQSVDTSDGLPQPVYSSMQSITDNIVVQETLSPTPTSKMEVSSSVIPTQDLSPYLLRLVFDPNGQDVQSEDFSNKLKSGLVAAFLEALKRRSRSNRRRKRDVSDPDVEVVLHESPTSTGGEGSVMFYIKVDGRPVPADEVLALLSVEELNTISELQSFVQVKRVEKGASTEEPDVKTQQPTQPSDTPSSSRRLQYSMYTDVSASDLQSPTPTMVYRDSEQHLDTIASMTQTGGFIDILPTSLSDGISHDYTPSTTETAYFLISRSGSFQQLSQMSPSFSTDSIFETTQAVLTTTSVDLDIFSPSTKSVKSLDIFPTSGSLVISSESGFTHSISDSASSSKLTVFPQTSGDVSISTSLLSSFGETETKLTMLSIDSITASRASVSTILPFSSNMSAIQLLSMSAFSPSSLSLDESQLTSGVESSSGLLIMESVTESRSLLLALTSSIILISESTESYLPPRTMIPFTDTGLITSSSSTLVMDTTQVELTSTLLSRTETLPSTGILKTRATTPILLTNPMISTGLLQTSTLLNTPILPSSQPHSNLTSITAEELPTTLILLSTPPSTITMESTLTASILSTPVQPTSSIVPITSPPPTTPPTSAPTTPSVDSLMVIKVFVKLDRNITDGVFQTEIENGLEKIYMDGAGINQGQRRRKRSLDDNEVHQPIVLFKRQVENEPKVTITNMDRDPTKQTDVSTEFYVIQNGQVVAPDKAVPVFNRLNDAQKSAILGYSAIGPVKAVGEEVTPASTTAPSDNTTLLFIVAIVLPCLLVLVLIIVIVKCYVVDRWNRGSILPYKRGESLGDHNLTIDIEKGEITPSRSLRGSEKGSQLGNNSPGTGKKIAVTSGTSNNNLNTEASTLGPFQGDDNGTNRDIKHEAEVNSRRNTLKDFAEMRDNESTHRNTNLSNLLLGLNRQDGGPSSTEIPNINHQQQNVLPKQITVDEDIIQKSTSHRRDRAPTSSHRSRQSDRRRSLERAQIFGMKESVIEATHVKKAEKSPKRTDYATMTPSVSTHQDKLAKDKSPEKNKSRKHKSRSEVEHHQDPRDYYYLTLKKPDPTSTSDSGDHTDASDEFTILVPKSPQGRIVEGHTNQIFFNNRMHATPIGAGKQTRSHRRGTLKGEEGLTPTSKSRIRSPIKKQRKTTTELKEFDPCYSPESASEVENDTPYNSSHNYSNDLSPNVDKPNIHPFDSPNRLRIPTSAIRQEQRRRAANREESKRSHLMQDFTVPYSRHARQVDDNETKAEFLQGHVSGYSEDRNPEEEPITPRSVVPSFNSNTFTKSDTLPSRPTNAWDQKDGDNAVGHYISQGRDSDKGLDNPGYSNDIFMQPKMKSTAIGPDVSTTETNTQTSDHETASTNNERNFNKGQGALPYVDPVKKDMITQTSRDFGAQAKLTTAETSSKSAACHSNVSNGFDTISQPVLIESLTQSSLVTPPTTSTMPSRDEHEHQTPNTVPNPFTLHSIQTRQDNQKPAFQTPLIQNVQTQRSSDLPVAEIHNNQFLQGLQQPQNTQMAQLQQPIFGSPRPTQASYYQSYPNQPLFYQAPNKVPETNLSYHNPDQQDRPATASQIHLIPDQPSQSTLPRGLDLYDNRTPGSATQIQPNYYNSHTSQYGNQYLAAPGYSSLPQTEIVPLNHQHDTMSLHPVTNEQIIVHSRMARYNPYEDIPPEPPAVRYHHIPEPNYLVQPEFPPLDSGIEQPDTLSNIPVFYQHPIKESPRHHVSSPRDQQQHTREYEEVIQSDQSDSWKDDSRNHRERDGNQGHRNDDDEDVSRRSDESQYNKNKKPGKEHVRFEDDSQTSPRRQPHDKKTHSASPKRSDKRRRDKHPDDDTETTSSLSSPRRRDAKNDDRSRRHRRMSPREEEKYENEKKHKASPKQTSEKEKVTKVSRPKKRKEKEDERHVQSGRRSPQSPERTPSPSPRRQKRNEPEERDGSSRSSSQTSSPRKPDHHDNDNDYSEEESYRSSGSKKSTPRSYESDGQYSEDSFLSESETESDNESSQLLTHGSREKDKGKSRQSNGRKPRRDERTYSDSEDESEISESRGNGRDNDDYYSEDSDSDRSTSRDKYQDDDRSKSRHGSKPKDDNLNQYSDDDDWNQYSDNSPESLKDQKNERRKPQRPDDKRKRDSSHESTPRSPNQAVSQSDDDKIKNNNPRSKQNPEEEIILYENRKTKKPQDLYAEIKAQMLKSYKDLNRKTAKSMPDKVQNLTDDQLLLLYEFHRKRLLFQRRQEASIKAKVLVNESFLAEEIQRLKKQQVDAKKKMKKLLNDAFPTTSSNDVEN